MKKIKLTCYWTGIVIELEKDLIKKLPVDNLYGKILYDNSIEFEIDLDDYNKI